MALDACCARDTQSKAAHLPRAEPDDRHLGARVELDAVLVRHGASTCGCLHLYLQLLLRDVRMYELEYPGTVCGPGIDKYPRVTYPGYVTRGAYQGQYSAIRRGKRMEGAVSRRSQGQRRSVRGVGGVTSSVLGGVR